MAVGKKKPKKIYMPGDFGDSKTRRNYRKSGPVVIYKYMEAFNKMGETIALSDFLQLPSERALLISHSVVIPIGGSCSMACRQCIRPCRKRV
jgi:hypothetical protein